ncbi:MAG: penicillin-binding protein 2 [Hydrogenophilus sp.]|nr:penicillin-binding protein 2 [Hydrogenophilus sp.]
MTYDLARETFRLPVPLRRLFGVLAVLGVGLMVMLARAMWLAVAEREFLQHQGELRYERVVKVPAPRGRILDRRGTILADSKPMASVWVDPLEFRARATREQQQALAEALGWSVEVLEQRLRQGGRRFVYVRRFLEEPEAERIASLRIPGVGVLAEPLRTYPQRETVASLVGLTDPDGRGIEGLERGLDSVLTGSPGKRLVVSDRQGNPVREGEWLQPPRAGNDVTLSIDLRVQRVVLEALHRAVESHRAQAAAGVVVDVKTGEVLALANWPTFDPEARETLDWSRVRNRALSDGYEPGSVIKPILVALALERGVVRPDSRVDVRGGSLTIAGHKISDVHASDRPLTVTEVVQRSSNVGVVKIAQLLPAAEVVTHYRRFGFGERPSLPLAGVTAGRLFSPKTIKPIELATMAYGHGMSASLLQVAGAYQAIANDGCRLPLTVLRLESPPRCSEERQVISVRTAREVQRMLWAVTEEGGTGVRARVVGYSTAGKTGTARKLEQGVYVHRYVSSFVGYAPASHPRVVVAVMVDEPQGRVYYGGAVAAPVFAEIVAKTLPLLGVSPDQPLQVVEARRGGG